MQITPSQNVIGAEITDVDLGQNLSAAEFGRIEDAFNRHSVVCFPQQQLDEPQLVAFARRFGEVEKIFLTHYAHPKYPEIMFVSNIKKDGRDIGHADAGSVWHTDMSIRRVRRVQRSCMRSKCRWKTASRSATRNFRARPMRTTACPTR